MSDPIDPAAMTPCEAARMLSAAGGKAVSPDVVTSHIRQGLPVKSDGTISLVQYAAWLLTRVNEK